MGTSGRDFSRLELVLSLFFSGLTLLTLYWIIPIKTGSNYPPEVLSWGCYTNKFGLAQWYNGTGHINEVTLR